MFLTNDEHIMCLFLVISSKKYAKNLTLGTTDRDRKLHPFGSIVVSREFQEEFEFLFEAIQNIDDLLAHVQVNDESESSVSLKTTKNAKKSRKKIESKAAKKNKAIYASKTLRDKLRADICRIQLLPTMQTFKKAVKLFDKKWRGEN